MSHLSPAIIVALSPQPHLQHDLTFYVIHVSSLCCSKRLWGRHSQQNYIETENGTYWNTATEPHLAHKDSTGP